MYQHALACWFSGIYVVGNIGNNRKTLPGNNRLRLIWISPTPTHRVCPCPQLVHVSDDSSVVARVSATTVYNHREELVVVTTLYRILAPFLAVRRHVQFCGKFKLPSVLRQGQDRW